MHWQKDGWYSEIDNYHGMDLKALMAELPHIKSNPDEFFGGY
jgi:hypothetical protein